MPARPYRNLQLGHVIEEEIARYIARNVPVENALVTVLGVDVTKDALHAQVRIGIIPSEKGPAAWKYLENRKSELEYVLLKKMRARIVPHLSFVIVENNAPQE